MTVVRDGILAVLGGLAEPGRRVEAAAALARSLGCEEVALFAPDPERGELLPAPGLPATLPDDAAWRAFLETCVREGGAAGELPGADGRVRPARGVGAAGGAVAVVRGADVAQADLEGLRAALPLLGALFAAERRAAAAERRVSEAGEAAERAGALTQSLQATRSRLEAALVDAEAAREEARERAREADLARVVMDAFYAALPVPAALVGPDLRFQRVNETLAAIYGVRPEAVVGKSLREVVPHYADRVEPYYLRVLETGTPIGNVELTVPSASSPAGERHYVVNYFPVHLPSGEVTAVGVVALDVTDRWLAETAGTEQARIVETLHRIGQSLASELELQRIVQTVTDAATELTGAQFGAFFYNVLSEAGESYMLYTISGVPREAFSKFPMPRNTPVFGPTFRGEGVVRSDDITRDPRYGQMEPYHGMPPGHLPVRSYLAVPVISRTGEVHGGLFFGHEEPAVFTEAHERIVLGIAAWAAVAMDNARLFEDEHRARAEAERANRVKSDFLAVMSHELRTPLNAILGYTDLLLAGVPEPIGPAAAQKIERIGLSARHLLELIEEILTFSRLEAGEEKVALEPVDLRAVAAEVVALVEPLALRKGIRFEAEVPADAGTIESDSRKVRQILVNLLTNAIKFTEAGVVGLAVATDAGAVVFRVRDTGPGIAPEFQEKIFEPFWQVEGGVSRKAGGTGLGLSVTRRLARLLGGAIELESEPGRGSTFTLRLPARGAERRDPRAAR